MFAREWKTRCPMHQKDPFIGYLYETGVKETSATPGFRGAQIYVRDLDGMAEVTLISFWESLEFVKAFAGADIEVAKLYPSDYLYELDPDTFATHYEVVENMWVIPAALSSEGPADSSHGHRKTP